MKIMVETSARHIHVTQEALEVLFGKGYQMTVRKMLSQPGQFATNERVTVVGPKRSFENVSILGPARKACQVELSLTDARSIGVDAPVRESGKIEGSAGCKLIGPAGELELKEVKIGERQPLAGKSVLDVVHRTSHPFAARVRLAKANRQRDLGELRAHAEQRRTPHPEHRAGSAECHRTGDAGDIAGADSSRERRTDGLERRNRTGRRALARKQLPDRRTQHDGNPGELDETRTDTEPESGPDDDDHGRNAPDESVDRRIDFM